MAKDLRTAGDDHDPRAPGVHKISGSRRPARAKCPRWLVPNCSLKPCFVRPSGGTITPALLTSKSRCSCAWVKASANAATELRSDKSSASSETLAEAPRKDSLERRLPLLEVAAREHDAARFERQHPRCLESYSRVRAGDDRRAAGLVRNVAIGPGFHRVSSRFVWTNWTHFTQ